MTIINQKSISGITSITFASAGDDLLTFHSNNGTERFRIDNSGNTTLNGNLDLQDDDKILIGTGDDLQIYHDGTDSYVQDSRDNGRLRISADIFQVIDKDASETMLKATVDGAVELNHNGSKKFETTSTGVTITGTATATEGLVLDGQTGSGKGLRLDLAGSGDYVIQETTTDDVVQFGGTGATNFFVHNISSGRIGIGITNPVDLLQIKSASGNANVRLTTGNTSSGYTALIFGDTDDTNTGTVQYDHSNNSLQFEVNNSERMRIDSSGRFLVGKTGSPSATEGSEALVFIQGKTTSATGPGTLALARGQSASEISGGASLGVLTFTDDAGNDFCQIKGATDGGAGTDDHPGRMLFLTTPNNSSSPTERVRLGNDGFIGLQGATATGGVSSGQKFYMAPAGSIYNAVQSDIVLYCNRTGTDGTLVELRHQNTAEGTISVSGTTVSYNGAHLSRWSQLPSGAARTEILRGSVMSNLNEMCEWAHAAQDAVLYTAEDELPEGASVGDVKTPAVDAYTEDNEQLNRMKVSDVEGDPNVAGVFQGWDDDDDTYDNDFYCAMTGDFIIRIAQGTTVARGDLLMSAGDGTAKPQSDDIVRSKTIAKVTSTTVSTTYSDGSYCVPCVLMAC